MTGSTMTPGLASLAAHLVEAKHYLGRVCAGWAGRGPNLAASISMTGMALEHEGHARALQSWLDDGQPRDDEQEVITWGSWLGGTQQPSLDWPTTVEVLMRTAELLGPTWQAFAGGADQRLRLRIARIVDEERRQWDCIVDLPVTGPPRSAASAAPLVAVAVLRLDLMAAVQVGELLPGAVEAWELEVRHHRTKVRSCPHEKP